LHDYQRQKLQKKELFKSMEAMMEYLPLKVGIEYQFIVKPCFKKSDGNQVIFRIVDSFMAF
jgi:hypothetical protein